MLGREHLRPAWGRDGRGPLYACRRDRAQKSGVTSVSAGGSHTCAVTTSGGLKCWGSSFSGQLGDGTNALRPTPVDVTGLTSGVASVSAGWKHTCAVTTVGGLKCWGFNRDGQLGDGRTFFRSTPVQVVGFMKAVGADLAVTKSDSPDPVLAGNSLSYTLTITNNGPTTSTGSVLTDILPSGVTFASSTPGPPTCTESNGTVACDLGDLVANASTTVTIQVAVNGTTTGTITNTVSVAGNEVDPDTANNTTTASTLVKPVADLSVAKNDSPDPVVASTTLTYTLTVGNNGPGTSTGAMLTDILPNGVAFVSSTPGSPKCTESNGTVACSLGEIASGATTTITIQVMAESSATSTITNTVTVSGAEVDPETSNNVATATTTLEVSFGIPVVVGFNLITMPVIFGSTITAPELADLIAAQNSAVVSIQRWGMGGSQTFDGLVAGRSATNPFELELGRGYFVKLTTAPDGGVFTVTGTPLFAPVPLDFVVGFNLVGVPFMTPSTGYTAKSLAQKIDPNGLAKGGVVASIQRWGVGGSQTFDGWVSDLFDTNSFAVDKTAGYFMKLSQVITGVQP